jgi:hypothetical protein
MKKALLALFVLLGFLICILNSAESRLTRKTNRLNEARATYQLKHDDQSRTEMDTAQADLDDEKLLWGWLNYLRRP